MISSIFGREFFRDRTMLVLLAILLIGLAVNMVIVLFNIEETNYPVPIRYSDFTVSVLERGSWDSLYVLPAFSLVSTVTSVVIAIQIHASRRDIAMGVLSFALFVSLLNVFIGNALLSLV